MGHGRKSTDQEEIHAVIGRKCKLHTKGQIEPVCVWPHLGNGVDMGMGRGI